ncbi:MFS transporter [Streptomyces albogriseolus]|uniref:MFS transporter n=1 Tax=Streptomyces albogriseolus TaxID=1887 RepID=UPI003F49E542
MAFAYFFEFANTFAITAPVVREQWGADVNHDAYVTSLSFVGMFIGAVVAGGPADRLGRRRTLTLTTLWFTVWVVAVVYISELFPSVKRGTFQAYAIVIGICGTPVTNLIASAVVPMSDWSWRLVYLWGSLGALFLFFVRRLEESPRWLESRGRHEEAEAALTRIEARATAEHGPLPEPRQPKPKAPAVTPGLGMLKDKTFLYPTILLSVLWITQTIGFFGYSSWAPTLLAAEGVSVEDSIFYVALTTVGAPLGSFLAAMVTDRFKRKWCLVVFGLVIAASGLLYGLTFTPLLIGVGYQAVFMVIAGTWTLGALFLAVFGPATRRRRLAAEAATAGTGAKSVTATP